MAQGGNPRPDQLWTFGTDGGATVNDVSIDADGKVLAAVQADGSAVSNDDDEVYAWDLTRSKTSSNPQLRDDPSSGVGQPEGLQVVDVHPNPGDKGDHVAVANEGSNDADANNIHVYRRSAGGDSETQATYPDDRSAPDGAVLELAFLDRSTLLAYHEDTLSLLDRGEGTEFRETQEGRWDPVDDTPGNAEEQIQDISVSRSQDRIVVLTSSGGDQTSDDTLNLYLLDADGDQLASIAQRWAREDVDPAGTVELSRNAQFAVVATGSNTFYYTGIEDYEPDDGEEDPPEKRFSQLPWSRNGPSDVSSLAISPSGTTLAAAFGNGELVVYEQTQVTNDGPRAERIHDATIDTGQAADRVTFVDGDRTILAQAAGLMAFHDRQLQRDEQIQPMWTIPQAQSFAASDDGERIVVAGTQDGDGVVQAYEQAYAASLDVEAPSQVQPSRSFNLTVEITNEGSTVDAFRLSTNDLDSAWTVDAPDDPLRLLPGETGNTTLSVTPSRTQAPGEVTFTVGVVSQNSPDQRTVASQEATVIVQEVHAAQVSIDTSERTIDRGNAVTLEPEVANDGNTREPIELRVRQDASWQVAIDGEQRDQASFTLDPTGTETPTVEVTAPDDAARGERNTIRLVAQPEDGGSRDEASLPVVVEPDYDASFEAPGEPIEVEAGERVNTDVTVVNAGNTRETFNVEVESEASNPDHLWSTELSTRQVTVADEGEETVTVTVDVPRDAETGDSATVTLTATSQTTGEDVAENSYELTIPEQSDDAPIGALVGLASLALAAGALRRRDR